MGRILEEYDTNKTYPVYGFGAKVSFLCKCYVCLLRNKQLAAVQCVCLRLLGAPCTTIDPVPCVVRQLRMPDGSMSECHHCIPLHIGGDVTGPASEVPGVDGILQVRLVHS